MTNREAIGYMLLACKELNLDKEATKKLFGAMYWQFDLKTEDEAEELGHEWYHSLDE
ncbi:hypothetical protein [Bacillus sp. ISL-55]|uniref:hypothetical protein n=1 Tax=Bacillus sp. ISL-55 TaxID=2819134 RepID=UPI001BEC6FB7|nr:hypothetical protein [Bacillus sp. ISL-55]MBT2695429.1 hypothetical protein [Bacillus sp. ISL-55]